MAVIELPPRKIDDSGANISPCVVIEVTRDSDETVIGCPADCPLYGKTDLLCAKIGMQKSLDGEVNSETRQQVAYLANYCVRPPRKKVDPSQNTLSKKV